MPGFGSIPECMRLVRALPGLTRVDIGAKPKSKYAKLDFIAKPHSETGMNSARNRGGFHKIYVALLTAAKADLAMQRAIKGNVQCV